MWISYRIIPDHLSQYVGFWLAFTLPTIIYLLCPIILVIGYKRYRHTPPSGSVLAKALQIWNYSARGRWSFNPIKLWKNMKADDFWESSKPSKIPLEQRPAWMTFDDAWVDEVRRGFKACSVFVWFPLYCMFSSSLGWVTPRSVILSFRAPV